jgi:molybdenum cofactor cytidylyltransferase
VLGLDAIGEPIDEAHVHRPALVRQVLHLSADQVAVRLTPAQAARLLIDPHGGAKSLPPGARLLPLLNKAETTTHLIAARLTAQCLLAAHQPCLIGAVGMEPPAVTDPIRERWGPISAVVLAAGQSRRMGQPKQLAVVDGEPMVVRAVRVAAQSGANEVLVVTGAYADQVADLLAPLQRSDQRIRLLHNPHYATGQASSIRTAVQGLAAESMGAIFLPVDQPFVPARLLQRLTQAWRQGACLVAARVDEQVRGAPALFDRTLWPDLLALQGDIGARPLLQQYRDAVVTIAATVAELRDLDTPDDLRNG